MKKLILLLLVTVSFSTVYGQNKKQEKKIKYFVEAAVQEYDLNKDQEKQLLDARNAYITEYMAVMKDFKAENINADEKKEKMGAINKGFNKTFAELTGKKMKDLQPFFKRMREELKNV